MFINQKVVAVVVLAGGEERISRVQVSSSTENSLSMLMSNVFTIFLFRLPGTTWI